MRKAQDGKAPKRRIGGALVLARLDKLADEVFEPSRTRLAAVVDDLDDAGRKKLRAHAQAMASYAQLLLRQLRG